MVGKMQVTRQRSGEKLVVTLSGRLDASTAPEFDARLDLQGVRELILDFLACDFISSAGIRSIMKANQVMAKCHPQTVTSSSVTFYYLYLYYECHPHSCDFK